MKLISMTDFVLEQSKKMGERDDAIMFSHQILEYANFLKQPLELWMFVPCDEDGNVLEEIVYSDQVHIYLNYEEKIDYLKRCKEYQQAKKRCLFEELKADKANDYYFIEKDRKYVFAFGLDNLRIIEDIVKYKLILTPTAIKQIGL